MTGDDIDRSGATWRSDRARFLQGAAALALGGSAADRFALRGQTAAAAKRGGHINFGMVDFLSTDPLDPAGGFSSFGFLTGGNLYDALTSVDNRFIAHPRLAQSFEASEGGRVWTFRLRDDVEFHSGKRLAPADVIYTYQRQFKKKTRAAFLSVIQNYVDPAGITAVDKRTVRFQLKQPHAFFPSIAAFPSFAIVQNGTTNFNKPAGTGPFKVESYQTGQRAEWVRNPNYWVSNRPFLDSIAVSRVPDPSTKLQSVISGQLDLVDAVEYSQLPVIAGASNVDKVVIEKAMYIPIDCDRKQAPFRDVRVRQAMKMAVDREKWVSTLFQGLAVASADVPVPPGDQFYPAGVKQWPHDPERAKSLLKAAGFADGFNLTIYTSPSGPGEVDAAVILKEMLKDVGVRANVISQDVDTFYAKAFLIKPCVVGWLLRGHASYISNFVYTSDAVVPESHFENKTFDRLIGEAIGSLKPAIQRDRFGAAFRLLNDTSGQIVPAHGSKVFVKKKRVQNVRLHYYDIVKLADISVA